MYLCDHHREGPAGMCHECERLRYRAALEKIVAHIESRATGGARIISPVYQIATDALKG